MQLYLGPLFSFTAEIYAKEFHIVAILLFACNTNTNEKETHWLNIDKVYID